MSDLVERLWDKTDLDCVKAAELITRHIARIRELEGERDTATRALAVLDRLAWLAAEEDLWFGNEDDIAVQRAAAERHRAARKQ